MYIFKLWKNKSIFLNVYFMTADKEYFNDKKEK